MKNVTALTKRLIRLYLRDKTAVFFSFLSTIILVALYFLFIAKIYAESMDTVSALSDNAKNFMIYAQMMMGVLAINSISVTLGVFATVAKDFETGRIDSFLLTPAKPRELLLGYFSGAVLIAFVLNLFTWTLSAILIGALTGYWVGAAAFLIIAAILIAASFISCAIMLMLTAIVKSSAALNVISGILGTFLGFLCGIYMPYSNLGKGAETVGSVLPVTHIAIWLKRTVLENVCAQLEITGQLKTVFIEDFYSAGNIGFCGLNVPFWGMLLYSALFALVCLVAAGVILRRKMKR
ncbi:MAG: ABC transporter permease [Oscillospiraceae bacterium]|jgi:multidrug/hemolysin transport system permease protein|nr:ABC transporter permease [Oscillospiraceae bacterium]